MSKSAQPIDFVKLARERSGEVESGSRRVHLVNPVAQAVHDQLQRARMAHVQAVAASGVIDIEAVVFGEAIVNGIVDAAEGQRRAELIALPVWL